MAKQKDTSLKEDNKNDTQTSGQVRDTLANTLAESLNKTFKDQYRVAYFLDGTMENPADISDWVSFGSTALDLAVSNRPNGGAPVGRIGEITGLEGSGKSLICGHLIANTQKKGGLAVYIDTENSLSNDFYAAIGVDMAKLLYIQLETVEDIFQTIDTIAEKIRSSDKNRLVTIIVDSVAGASTKVELEGDYDQSGYATQKAIIISKSMRKITNLIGKHKIALIFTNQVRQKLGAMAFADQWTTSGGKALAFHCSWRLRCTQVGQIKNKDKTQVLGVKTDVKVIKNRLGPPYRKAEFNVYFNRGIDDYESLASTCKTYGIFKAAGSYNKWVDTETGEEIQFLMSDFKKLITDRPELRVSMYKELCDHWIMKYHTPENHVEDDDVEVVASSDTEN